ncbi:MAG: 2,3-bisphosphoglycerate-independent phosphoglycerate mutase, partial [Myxococcales bacterium]|nr:2,3-bisphosphoglycerate-independent phosphoglycerate mutase [Myxococcales bacterium]
MSMQTLSPHPWRRAPEGPVVAIVMDGVGIGTGDHGDAVAQAHTPTLDALRGLPSFTSLLAHGTAVGMPSDADMGNSEVGHN